ncbi:MAG: N-methyl-L-tryptophan oxidase [bacterium]|nr:N-methyl-L-tryptophan oxidase [Planctomycetota bacterium]HIL50774.1 N-methyl-L-tryptophan oxidase [Planctomycetota bacterium]
MTPKPEVIVVGCGGVGSAALMHLARAGVPVLGLDRFAAGHDHGSSHGETRIIRMSYFEHPDYVPLLQRSFELWEQLELSCGQPLYHETGLLQVGPPDGVVVPGVKRSAAEHGLAVEQLGPLDLAERFRGFQIPAGHEALFEARAGVLCVEDCVAAHLRVAVAAGADLRHEVRVESIEPCKRGVKITTDAGDFEAARAVICAGAWAGELLASLSLPLEVLRKSLFWYAGADEVYRADCGAPAFFFETEAGMFYGFPAFEAGEIKVAEHTGGTLLTDPLDLEHGVLPAEAERMETFLAGHLPAVATPHARHATCLYTKTPDEHFIVDRVPDAPQIAFAAGLSGHGFKFASALGEQLCDLTLGREGRSEAAFLSLERFH